MPAASHVIEAVRRLGRFARRRGSGVRGGLAAGLMAAALVASGCQSPAEVQLRREVSELQTTVQSRDNQVAAQRAAIDELNSQLAVARAISEDDLKVLFYPDHLVIDKLTGGADYDNKPGDDGVTVYLRPIDRDGDLVKVPGDITIQLYDLAAPAQKNFIGEYRVPVDRCGKLWHGKLWTGHFSIKCPWPSGPPEHSEVTVRALFVDYLTKRVVSAQSVCKVNLPPK